MSIEGEIQRIQTNIANAYLACQAKGVTLPETLDISHLVDTIGLIGTNETHTVRVIDYDATILKEEVLQTGDTFTLPNTPSHTGLVFQEWSSPVDITNNTVTVTNSDIVIGPTYTTASGLSEFDISLTPATGKTITLKMDGTKNWGDGTSNTLTSHTYSNYGNYTITCNGNFTATSATTFLFGQTTNDKDYICNAIRLANVSSGVFSVYYCNSLETITIANNLAANVRDTLVISECPKLKTIIYPKNTTNTNISRRCYSLKAKVFPNGVQSIAVGDSMPGIDVISIPSTATSFVGGNQDMSRTTQLSNLVLPNNMKITNYDSWSSCTSLKSIKFPQTATPDSKSNNKVILGEDNTFNGCYNLINVSLSSNLQIIPYNAFRDCVSLRKLKFPSTISTIGSTAFTGCGRLLELDFTQHSVIPTLEAVFTDFSPRLKIKVPWNLYEQWKSSSNWNQLAKYIDGGTPATLNFNVTPNTSTIYLKGYKLSSSSGTCVGPTASYVLHDTIHNVIYSEVQTNITEAETINITKNLTTYNTITLQTGITNLNVQFIVSDVTINATDEGNGNYSINVVDSDVPIGYAITGTGYSRVTGTITTTGSDINIPITMQTVTEQPWTRPNLSSNGILGENSFAISCTNSEFEPSVWQIVDEDAITEPDEYGSSLGYNTYWYGHTYTDPVDIILYNPNALNITNIRFVYNYMAQVLDSISGSNDSTNWTPLSFTLDSESSYDDITSSSYKDCPIDTQSTFYKYYKISFGESEDFEIYELQITATELV